MDFEIGVLGATEEDKPDGLCGMVGGFEEGDTGRLPNVLSVGGIGVLEGRSGGTVKFRKDANGSFRDGMLGPTPVGTDGRVKGGDSSSSSMEGKLFRNSDRLMFEACGEDGGDDDGDGGPKVDGDTKLWGDGDWETGVAGLCD